MKKRLQILFFAIGIAASAFGQATQANFLGNWHDDNLVVVPWLNGRYNECWGFAQGGHEYGVLGSTAGLHFIDVTNPTDPVEAFFVEGASSGTSIVHRDFKDYKGYLYAVADEGSTATLQIVDIQDLPNSLTEVYNSNEFVVTSHNLFIDTSQAKLYLLGAQGKTKILDISNPADPVLLGSYPNGSFYMPYVHDAYIRDNIGIMDCGGDGLWVIDFSDPASPVLLGTMTDYPGAGYNHSGWLSEDGHYYYMLDETHGSPVKVVDMSDYTDLKVVASINAFSAPSQIPHNALIRDNILYVSYYYDGLQAYDITDPLNPERIAYYDTYDGPDDTFYAGAWGVNPFLPSGNILISDIQSGLWVFAALTGENINLYPSSTDFEACADGTVELELIIGDGFTESVSLEATGAALPGSVTFSPNPADPGATVTVSVTNLTPTQGLAQDITLSASDGVHENSVDISLNVLAIPGSADMMIPLPDAVEVPLQASFEWGSAPYADSYKLKISDDLDNFNANIVYSATTAATSFTLSTNLTADKTYYWLVESKNDCGSSTSATRSFYTGLVNGLQDLDGNAFSAQPNPANETLHLRFEQPLASALAVELSSLAGQVVQRAGIQAGEKSLDLNLAQVPAGLYLLRLAGEHQTLVQKIAKN